VRAPPRLRVEIDERPLQLPERFGTDYVTRLVRAALQSGAAATTREDGREVVLSPRGVWADGRPVVAHDLIETLSQARRHPLWRLPLAGMTSAHVDGADVVVSLAGPNRALAAAMRTPELAPGRDDGVSNGVYTLATATPERLCCEPNPHWSGASERPGLDFVLNRDVHASAAGFRARRFDVSCNTGLPYGAAASLQTSTSFRQADSGIWAQLDFTEHPVFADEDTRHALRAALDLPAICRAIGLGLQPAHHFGPAALVDGVEPAASARQPTTSLKGVHLVVAYNDYYPNRLLIEGVGDAWARAFGVVLQPRPVPFGQAPNEPHHLRLCLNFAHYDHPLAALGSFIGPMARWGGATEGAAYGRALTRLRSAPSNESGGAVREALGLLGQTVPCIPLATLRSLWLQAPCVGSFRYAPNALHDFSRLGAA